MTLRRRESRALDRIEASMRSSPDRLARTFAVFSRLAGDEPMPSAEQITPITISGRVQRWSGLLVALAVAAMVIVIPGWLALSRGPACTGIPATVSRMLPFGTAPARIPISPGCRTASHHPASITSRP